MHRRLSGTRRLSPRLHRLPCFSMNTIFHKPNFFSFPYINKRCRKDIFLTPAWKIYKMKLEDVPTEVILCIMDCCDAVTLTQLELVSQFFNTLARDTLARRISRLVGGRCGLTLTVKPGGMAEEVTGGEPQLCRPQRLSTNRDQEFGWEAVPKYWTRPMPSLEKMDRGRDLCAQSRLELDECQVTTFFGEDVDFQPVQLKVGIDLDGMCPMKVLDTWTLVNKAWGQDGEPEYLVRHKDLRYKMCVRKIRMTNEQQNKKAPQSEAIIDKEARMVELYAVTVSELVLNTAQVLDRAEQLLSSRMGMAMTPVHG